MRFYYRKADRLTNSKDIEKLFRTGKAFFDFPLRLVVDTQKSPGGGSKSAVIVPKRQITKAQQRNLIKRRLREIIRLELPVINSQEDHLLHGRDFLLIYAHNSTKPSYADIKNIFYKLLENSKL